MTAQRPRRQEAITRRASRSMAFVVAAWRAVTPKHVLYTFVLSAAWCIAVVLPLSNYSLSSIRMMPAANAALSAQLNGFAVLFAVLLADQASPPSTRRWWPYAA